MVAIFNHYNSNTDEKNPNLSYWELVAVCIDLAAKSKIFAYLEGDSKDRSMMRH